MEVNNNDKNNSNKVETIKKNYKWSKANVDNARKKINKLIFQQERQASINIKLDDLSIFINDEIKKRGIQRGFVNIQEDFNKNILNIEKIILRALMENDAKNKYNLLIEAQSSMKIHIWSDIRFLMVNKAITPGEITELIRRQKSIDSEMEKWIASIQLALSAEG